MKNAAVSTPAGVKTTASAPGKIKNLLAGQIQPALVTTGFSHLPLPAKTTGRLKKFSDGLLSWQP